MVSGDEFESLRKELIGFCYRMLGSLPDAEDVAQDAYLRWEQAGRPQLDSPRSWYLRVCARLCLDRIKSVQYQREKYIGPWLPEPILEDHAGKTELDETISIALMLTIERLKPAERGAFILHDLFGYEFAEVADILGLQPAHCRQLAKRARDHLKGNKPRSAVDVPGMQRISDAFFQAVNAGDLDQLRTVLSEDVVMHTDGGGKISAAKDLVVGFDAVTTFLVRVVRNVQRFGELRFEPTWFNGSPGMISCQGDQIIAAYQLYVVDGKVAAVFVYRNPDKLALFDRTPSV
ncbi:RNA polymerase sigma factor SigJ [Bremerella sp. T1]|uniref:RNA polymerase sigma factor SigJ n=1 Tax=Bremerella sp. TYQ1 TaxID=3119568 RepID=UPI001CCB81D0|nr:RNA polymerase sigma factor SigJ [Bremerella volcania]UBM37883.1 RNA polymerase sigma factor SigJ [Bremerella volcania]